MALPIQTGNGISASYSFENVQCTQQILHQQRHSSNCRMTRTRWASERARFLACLLISNEFLKDDWNVMHIATRHSATWRNTYQPQILPYILNIVTLTAIAYSSKRIYWHRARFAWNCWLLNAYTYTHTQYKFVSMDELEHVLNTIQANLQPSTLGRRLKSTFSRWS